MICMGDFWNAEITGSIFVSSVDSLDWKEQGVEAEINQVLNHKHLGNGSILLFHNDAKYTPQALDTILKGLKEKGYDIVPVSELIHTGEYTVDHEGRQIPSGEWVFWCVVSLIWKEWKSSFSIYRKGGFFMEKIWFVGKVK